MGIWTCHPANPLQSPDVGIAISGPKTRTFGEPLSEPIQITLWEYVPLHCDPADQPEGPPRSNSPKLLGRLPGALPGKIGVLGGVPGVVLGELPGHC